MGGLLPNLIPNGYAGLQWNNFSSYDTVLESNPGPNGLINGVVSPSNVAFNAFGQPASIGGLFNLNSAYLMADWNDGLQVEVRGFVGGRLTYDNTYTVGTQGSTLINFNYLGVDEVDFISSGGVHHQGFYNGIGTQFGMDNLSITIVPEPSPLALLGLAVICLSCRLSSKGWRLPLSTGENLLVTNQPVGISDIERPVMKKAIPRTILLQATARSWFCFMLNALTAPCLSSDVRLAAMNSSASLNLAMPTTILIVGLSGRCVHISEASSEGSRPRDCGSRFGLRLTNSH